MARTLQQRRHRREMWWERLNLEREMSITRHLRIAWTRFFSDGARWPHNLATAFLPRAWHLQMEDTRATTHPLGTSSRGDLVPGEDLFAILGVESRIRLEIR